MAKTRSEKPTKVEIQKGPVSMREQFDQGFKTRSDCTKEDYVNAELRRSGQTLTFHEPKR